MSWFYSSMNDSYTEMNNNKKRERIMKWKKNTYEKEQKKKKIQNMNCIEYKFKLNVIYYCYAYDCLKLMVYGHFIHL